MIRYYVITLAILLLCMSCNAKAPSKILQAEPDLLNYVINEDLSLKDYSNTQGYFPQDGFIPTAELAFQIAESILVNIYGKDIIEDEKPYSINLENGIWLIEGSLEEGIKGGVAYIEINKYTGEILKVIHTE